MRYCKSHPLKMVCEIVGDRRWQRVGCTTNTQRDKHLKSFAITEEEYNKGSSIYALEWLKKFF